MDIKLLTKYENDRDYYQTLQTALADLGPDEFFKLLEEAEKEGKRIHLEHTLDQEKIITAGGCVDGGYQYTLK
jgi:hypothetical protein